MSQLLSVALLLLATALSAASATGFTTYTTADGLAFDQVRWIMQDGDGALWFATDGGGVSRYDGEQWITLTTDDGLAYNEVETIVQDRAGVYWFATDGGGVSRYDGLRWQTFTTADGLAYGEIEGMIQAADGTYWIATEKGANRYDGSRWQTFTTADGLALDELESLYQDSAGDYWFGTDGDGASRYNGGSWKTYSVADGLADNRVRAIYQDRTGVYWFATERGVSRYDGNSWQSLSTSDGLVDDTVNHIMEDDGGHLWFATDGGVSRFDGQIFISFTVRDGLAGETVHCVYQDRDGNMWFATEGGVTTYRPRPGRPPVVQVSVVADRRYENPTELGISSQIRLVAFELEPESSRHPPESIIFYYRLTGYDPEWQTSRDSRIEYEHLPRGDYTFEVRAIDRDLVYSKEPVRTKLEVYFPRTWLALGALVLFAGALVIVQSLRVYQRERSLRRLHDELQDSHDTLEQRVAERTNALAAALEGKELLIKEIHHRVKNNLQIITSLLNLQSRKIDNKDTQALFEDSSNRVKSMALIHEYLYQSEDLVRIDFASYINTLVPDLLETYRTNGTHIDLDMQLEQVALPPEAAVPCGLILNELVTNSLKYAYPEGGDGRIRIGLRQVDGRVQLSVADDGVGLPKDVDARMGQSLGLTMVHTLIGQLQGELEIDDQNGTLFRFSFTPT